MRVIIANPVIGDAYGQEGVVRILAEGLERRGHEVFLLGEERAGAIPSCAEYRIIEGLTSFHLLSSQSARKSANEEALEFVDRIKPDVVHFFDQYNAWLTSSLVARYPSVFSAHTVAPTCPASNRLIKKNNTVCTVKSGWGCVLHHHRYGCLDFLKSPLHRIHGVQQFLFKRHAIEKAGAVIAISDYVKNLLIQDGFALQKVSRIYNPVDVSKVRGFSGTMPSKLIVAACRLVPLKGLEYLIRAFARLADPDARLWIVGEGPSEAALRDLARHENCTDRVEFCGKKSREETLGILQRASIVAQTNVGPEAFGLTVAEAQALGVPVIGFDTPALNEIIVDNETGFLVPSHDEERLIDRMRTLLKDSELREKFSKSAAQRAKALFPAEKHVDLTLAAYQLAQAPFTTNAPRKIG